jgi:hypothetical protein
VNGRLDRLLIGNRWQRYGTAEDLAQAISRAIREALPAEPESADPQPARPLVRDMSLAELREYMAMSRDYSRKVRRLSERVALGELQGEPAPPPAEEGQNVELRFRGGRFSEVLINPSWAEKATANSIVEAVLRAFDGVPLVAEPPAAGELAGLRSERARIREFAQG